MSVEVKVNELPESVADGTLVVWHKQPGDEVKADEPLAEIETDKVVLEIAAPSAGIVGPQLRKKGESVKRGDVITTIDATAGVKAEAAPKKTAPKAGILPGKKATATATTVPNAPAVATPPKSALSAAAPATTPAVGSTGETNVAGLAPAVRRLLDEHKLSPADVTGSGPRGRVTKEDVLRHLEHSPQLASNIGEAPTVVEISEAPARSAAGALAARPTTRTKMTRLRARIAERMLEAQRSAAILTTFNEINMQALMDLRRNYKEAFQTQHGVKLGIMGFFVKACAEALRRYPAVNASVDSDDIVYHGYFDIGVAVSTTRGLVVPVLRDADRMSLAEIERSIVGFGARGEEGKLGIDELTGGTFTISNGGVFGSMLSTPILNPPQSAILGLHRVQPRPVAEGDKVVIRPMMYLALSYDHRIIDGREAVLFLVAIKELIEDPTRFILRV
ncbi:MAG TPA: 2-oxoglutarate dehydrogenase complex dihydrolipoyllysine-residue succinyltransferase [Polyangia bacterium]